MPWPFDRPLEIVVLPDFREAPVYSHIVKENTVAGITALYNVTHGALNIQPLAIPGGTSRRLKGAGGKGHVTPTATCAPKCCLEMYECPLLRPHLEDLVDPETRHPDTCEQQLTPPPF